MNEHARSRTGWEISRREVLRGVAAGLWCAGGGFGRGGVLRVATFAADVTPPLGHALMGGGIAPAREVGDPLEARCIAAFALA
jgi:hypothetical protein